MVRTRREEDTAISAGPVLRNCPSKKTSAEPLGLRVVEPNDERTGLLAVSISLAKGNCLIA